MSPLRVLVADDEPAARHNLVRLLAPMADVVVEERGDGVAALARIREGGLDAVFLDIAMPEKSGLEVAREIAGPGAPEVVFVTAYDQHALAAFDACAVGYLLKPVEGARLAAVVERLRARRQGAPSAAREDELARLVEALREDRWASRLAIRSEGRTRFLSTAEIDWIQANDDEVIVHAGAQTYALRERLSSLEGRLSPREFLRVHRSAIVRIDRVQEIQPWFGGDHVLILAGGAKVRTGRTYREAVQRLLTHH